MPAIIGFLGYNPLSAAKAWGEQHVRRRTTLEMAQEPANRLGRAQSALAEEGPAESGRPGGRS